MKFKSNLSSSSLLVDMTPLVDVIFLMLIFFIVTSDVLPLKSLHIQTPSLPLEEQPLTTQILIVMDAQNVIYVGSKKKIVALTEVEEHLKEEIALFQKQHRNRLPTIVMSIDQRVDYGSFLQLFAQVQKTTQKVRLVFHSEFSD